LALDVQSDEVLQKYLKKCDKVGVIASEELPEEMNVGEGEYGVAYDPLDGSSLVDVNLSVGTIVSIYKAKTFIGSKGTEMICALFVVYGPRTTMIITWGKGAHEFELNPLDGEWRLKHENLKVGAGKMFSPGNLRAAASDEKYAKVIDRWVKEGYTLRYSGGMVPDINQIILKGKGIFTYPGYGDTPNGKLRMLFECRPMSYLMEQAGGMSSDGHGRLLERDLEKLEQRVPIFVGSRDEVEIVVGMMG
ncbi:fructose-1,6-bisphosphatase, partial [Patescibacteria group bacterium]|nr:fructose-1,6-bisphosphatase [Patescibacteria group bacterium]